MIFDHNKIYNLKETAELLRVSTATIQRYCRAGRLHGQRIGRQVLILGSSIAEFLQTPYVMRAAAEPAPGAPGEKPSLPELEKQQLKNTMLEALRITGNNRAEAAKRLGVSHVTFYRWAGAAGLNLKAIPLPGRAGKRQRITGRSLKK